MTELKHKHRLTMLLRIAQISRSTFYYHLAEQLFVGSIVPLRAKIQALYYQHKDRYGYQRIATELRQSGKVVSHKKVQRLGLKLIWQEKSCVYRR